MTRALRHRLFCRGRAKHTAVMWAVWPCIVQLICTAAVCFGAESIGGADVLNHAFGDLATSLRRAEWDGRAPPGWTWLGRGMGVVLSLSATWDVESRVDRRHMTPSCPRGRSSYIYVPPSCVAECRRHCKGAWWVQRALRGGQWVQCCSDVDANCKLSVYDRHHSNKQRPSYSKLLSVVRCLRKIYEVHTLDIEVAGPTVWDALPDSLRDPAVESERFRRDSKTNLFAGH